MKKCFAYMLIIIVALVSSCNLSMNDDYKKNVSNGSGEYTVSGVIIDNAGKGISGITVELIGESTQNAITAESGGYTFENITNGSYIVTPPKEYKSMSISVEGDNVFVGTVKSGGHGGKKNGDYSCSSCHG